ncbi:MAG: hypothetical protein WCO05_00860 [Candidatus Moraniibacteriota bacterium]|jgi:hypothetical protein
MLQGPTSAGCPAENVKPGMKKSIMLRYLAKEVDWRNENEIREFLQERFAVSSLSPSDRSGLYIDLMMVLSLEGLVFHTETKSDLKRLQSGYDVETIQSLLLPGSEYQVGQTGNC